MLINGSCDAIIIINSDKILAGRHLLLLPLLLSSVNGHPNQTRCDFSGLISAIRLTYQMSVWNNMHIYIPIYILYMCQCGFQNSNLVLFHLRNNVHVLRTYAKYVCPFSKYLFTLLSTFIHCYFAPIYQHLYYN